MALALPASSTAQEGPPPEVRAAVGALIEMLESSGDAPLVSFLDARLSATYRDSATREAFLALLRELRDAAQGSTDDVAVERAGEGLVLHLSGERTISISLHLDGAGKVTHLELLGAEELPPSPFDNLTWDNLPEVFQRAADEAGFSGVVVARHDGEEILRKAYGLADRGEGRPIRLNTIFGIGSTPIDFTVTAILILAERGQVGLDDPLSRFIPNVPLDKQAITLRHLMTGGSGLPNFHDVPGVDWDPDLAWIDRDTAVRRILAQPLLFEPGSGDGHSHSAFGLLAAVIEIASGTTYRDFVRSEILEPVGMSRTGFYGESLGLDVSAFATGYGASTVGIPNIPPNWGPTSWLVMGSGGMFSTLEDMERYYDAIDAGRLLQGEGAQWQQGARVGIGGSDRGFFILEASNGEGSRVLLLANGEGRAIGERAMVEAIASMVLGRPLRGG